MKGELRNRNKSRFYRVLTETGPVSETSCLFFFFLVTIKIRTMDKVQNPSNSVRNKSAIKRMIKTGKVKKRGVG
jgi:hypothetical protein